MGKKSKRKNGHRKETVHRQARIPIPLQPIKSIHRIEPKERSFLEAAEKGDKHTMIRCLQVPNPVNVNCTDMLGRTAIQIAVDNENTEIVEILLKQDGVKIGDALLYAIREGVYRIVEMLIDHPSITYEMLGSEWSKNRHTDKESSDYSADISPIILAAHCNQFEILQLLIQRGAYIDPPHELSCSCRKCQEEVHEDSLRHSLLRINTFKALASPAWLSMTSNDPILAAFRLSWNLGKLAMRENEFKDTYLELGTKCKKYACDLLNLCRSSEEVIAVLNKSSDDDSDNEDEASTENNGKLKLSRLKLALKYEQKEFVAHPNCQQLLTSIWYEGLPGWRKRNSVTKFLICMGLIFILPFMSVYYWMFPRSKIGQLLRSPFMKFLYHSASFGVFLFLLVMTSTEISSHPDRGKYQGPPPSGLEVLIAVWVTGFIWAECKQIWDEGLKAYIWQWWNWMDFIMLSLYLATFSLRAVAYFQFGSKEISRKYWPENDPTLISEGLFAVANVLSFARIIYLFQANQHLGPLQISLGCMLIDIAKFLFLFFLVLTSFACGLNQLYWYYKPTNQTGNDAFYTLGDSYVTLFWSLFSLTQLKDVKIDEGQYYTEMIGELLFISYHAMAIIVLINMLIAMMSSSFQEIENHADMEWKYSRSKLWMGYFDEGSTLPSPFNLIVSPKSLINLTRGCYQLVKWCFCRARGGRKYRKSSSASVKFDSSVGPADFPREHAFKTEQSGQPVQNGEPVNSFTANGSVKHRQSIPDRVQYGEVMKRLVMRYIHQTKKQLRQGGVSEDDLLEIRQDISSLRYELREDRKREMCLIAGHFETLKKNVPNSVRLPSNLDVSCSSHLYVDTSSPRYSTHLDVPLSPVPNTRMLSPYKEGFLVPQDIDNLRQEIVNALRVDIREIASEIYQETVLKQFGEFHVPPSIPSAPSDLYHTHMYTQL